jgi:hypothetical protein
LKLATEVVVSTPREMVYFDHLQMDIVPEGLLVKAKAPLFAEWIKSQSLPAGAGTSPSQPTFNIRGSGKFYYPADTWAYQKPYGFAAHGAWNYFADEKPNLIWLFNTALAEGCEYTFKLPISHNNWEDYFTMCCRAVQEIWVKELRHASISAKFKEILDE